MRTRQDQVQALQTLAFFHPFVPPTPSRLLLYFRQMSSITLSLSDDLATQIRARQQQLPRILELGLRELDARGQSGFDGAADVLELLNRPARVRERQLI
jgi:hypothetical protein